MRWNETSNNLEEQFPSRDHSWNQGPEGKILVYLKNSKMGVRVEPGVPCSGDGIV